MTMLENTGTPKRLENPYGNTRYPKKTTLYYELVHQMTTQKATAEVKLVFQTCAPKHKVYPFLAQPKAV